MSTNKFLTNRYLIAGAAVLVIMASCSKHFLTKYPNDSTSSSDALGTVSGLQTALNGAYYELRQIGMYGRDLPVIGDIQADNTFVEQNNSGRYLNQFKYLYTSSDGVVEEIWADAYVAILDCNNVIDAKVTGADAIKAQAYALRALMYFKLVTLYARPYTDNPNGMGVPLVLHYQPALLPGRDSISKVYAQIISDYKTALQNAPAYTNSVTLSKYSIEALLARAYLYMGDNTDANAAAVDVINNGGFTLDGTAAAYAAFWHNSAVQSNQEEVLFEIDQDATNNLGSDDLGQMYYYGGYQDIYATQQLVSLYSATDIRDTVLVAGTTKAGFPATLCGKYINGTSTDKDNPKVIRLAEVYLIAAESSLPNSTAAQQWLNLLMSYRDPAFPGYTSTGAQLLSDIVNERRKELAFEGDRIFDLNRLMLPVNRAPESPGSISQNLDTIPYSNYLRVYPIPLTETQANAVIAAQQNPGYK
jgi:starch-binding outer membrane protein, SusD/RagB family